MTQLTVSVMMPCYNARESLPWAIGSLLAQTFEDWELVLVDDGSTDRPEEIVEQANDARIRLISLPENRGRGAARQMALDHTRGELLAMLDADDWMYPARLQIQVDAMGAHPGLAVVSAGLAVVDRRNDIVGVRMTGDGQPKGPHYGVQSPVAHAPSMYRRSSARGLAYDPSMRYGEDQDFLLRLLQCQRYLLLPDALYAYAEPASVSAAKAARSQRYYRARMRKHFGRYPRASMRGVALSYLKQAAYTSIGAVGLNDKVLQSRSRQPREQECQAFIEARASVGAVVSKTFSQQALPS